MKHIASAKNEIVKQWKKLLTKKGRLQTNRFLIEGEHLIEEAVRAGIVKELIVRESYQVPVLGKEMPMSLRSMKPSSKYC